MAERFNANEVKSTMSSLEGHFQIFAETLKDINTTVNDLVNNGADSAIFGEVGSSLLNTWNYNASTFGDFHANFQNWSEVVSVIAANNAQFVVTAESIYRSNGSNLEGVQSSRAAFAADPTASEYYRNANTPTHTPEDEAAAFIAAYGAISNGTTAWLNNYENLSPEARAIVSAEAERLQQGNTAVWKSYEDAAAAGFPNIRTLHEFARGGDDKEKYGTYQNYLNAMYEKYVGNSNPSGEVPQNPVTPPAESTPANTSVRVVSGQEVVLNGEKCYFLMRDSSGKNYYVKGTDAKSQVFVADENGTLTPYLPYGSDKIVSRDSFVDGNKHNLSYQWNIQYNNGTSPYDSVGTSVDSSFTANVDHPDQGLVSFSNDYLQTSATTLDSFDRGNYGINGNADMPEVIYLAPGQSIKYDKPWDTYDNKISGGSTGKYMVYDATKDAYFVVENGSYKTSSEGTFGLWISREQLLNERTTLNK